MTKRDAIKTLHELWRETNDPWYEEVYNMAIEALSADVVRCKDCRYYLIDEFTSTTGWCYKIKNSVYEDDYCSWGERREP